MHHPLLYEINTRCWLRELSQQRGEKVTLASVPDAEFARWRQLGFTHIWLMGVWTTGPRARAQALEHPQLRAAFDTILPGWREEDVGGSPYAIADYKVPRALGGEAGLKKFRQKLHAQGIKLILDFVSNHVGLDHPWISQRPELFVQSPMQVPETFAQETADGVRWLAHGKDPYFPAWTDTVQLDYRRADTRAGMVELLQSVARRCDGVRCDMAMLLLNDVFAETWIQFPGPVAPAAEFWAEAIQSVKKAKRDFLFLGEVYWDLESRLQGLGFDYTYDKRLYDHLVEHRPADLQRHLLDAPPGFVNASAHFLENHDEPRIATRLNAAEHRAAALLVLGLPGLRFLHDGQLTGSRIRAPVQLSRRPLEPVVPEIAALYEQLLAALRDSAVGQGEGKLLRPRPAWPDNPTAQSFILTQWQTQPHEFDLMVVNLAPHRSQCYAPLSIAGLSDYNWSMRDLLGPERHERFGNDLQTQGLYLDVPSRGSQLFHFQAIR